MIFEACLESLAFRSGILRSAIWAHLPLEIVPTLLRLGLAPSPCRCRSPVGSATAAGGVFVTNVNERSS